MSYTERDNTLKEMGLGSYAAYLESPLWAGIRAKVFCRDGRNCRSCGKRADQIHHRSYDKAVLLGHNIKPLHAICGDCHQAIEFTDGQKNSLAEANRKLDAMLGRCPGRKNRKKPRRRKPRGQEDTPRQLLDGQTDVGEEATAPIA